MSVPPPPPPPPPPAAIKSPIPATNTALLNSIQKGTKLKKVPESVKNDRSEVKLSNAPTKNGPQKPAAINGTNSSAQDRTRLAFQPPGSASSPAATAAAAAANRQFSDIQSVLINQISNVNLRKTSVTTSQPPRPAVKSSAPLPNQMNAAAAAKAPPPPPQTAKPALRSSMSSEQRTIPDYPDIPNKPIIQPPVRKVSQSSQPYQAANARNVPNATANGKTFNPAPVPPPNTKKNLEPQKNQPNFSVIRKTPNPPPPVARGSMELLTKAPPVPLRVATPVTSSAAHAATSQSRPASGLGSSQYKVLDRPPPPPPPINNHSIQYNQRISTFDQRFQFPSEKFFPKPDFTVME